MLLSIAKRERAQSEGKNGFGYIRWLCRLLKVRTDGMDAGGYTLLATEQNLDKAKRWCGAIKRYNTVRYGGAAGVLGCMFFAGASICGYTTKSLGPSGCTFGVLLLYRGQGDAVFQEQERQGSLGSSV